mmetsp:Transcript_3882/g.13006  ORF Transcript_3882/g.13006 Transcript_3882/m.13006 type:complete len:207 (+) Transcript_3882:368-988(+)
MWLAKPTSSYSPTPSSTAAGAPGAAEAPWSPLAAAMAASRPSAWEKSQSAARSTLPPVCPRATEAWSRVKPILSSMAAASGSGPAPGPVPGAGAAPGGGSGSLKSGSSMWAKTHSMETSVPALLVATAARLEPFSEKPIATRADTMVASGSTTAAAAAAAPEAPSGSGGCSCSPGWRPVPRRCSKESCSGMRTRASSFLGVQSSAT